MPTTAPVSPRRPGHRSARRTTLAEKLALLARGASPAATRQRVDEFHRLFAYRYTGAVVTRVCQGPRAWAKLPERLRTGHLVRHLLGDRVPGLEPVWYGARSLSRTRWFCVDVDADRTPEQLLNERYDLEHADGEMRNHLLRQARRTCMPKSPFADRLQLVGRALRRMGVDPADPTQVLTQVTPSGGQHLYVFLDGDYHLETVSDLLESAGLKHAPGEVELFPAVNRALRLPFGHLPGRPHDPDAWAQFVDDYRNGRVRRFSLPALREQLDRHHDRWARQRRSVRATRLPAPLRPIAPPPPLGTPKAARVEPIPPTSRPDAVISSFADAEALFARGIEWEGTRTEILKALAAHLIWFRRLSAGEAAAALITWAMNPRHRSKDIAADLARGTRAVAAQIEAMCRWYAAKKSNHHASSTTPVVRFAPAELAPLRAGLRNLAPGDRRRQAVFLLHFLAFAKRHGTPAPDGTGRYAAPAVNAVIKKWPGCHHTNYKVRVDHAVAAGVLTLIKGSWHNHAGPGRARTYRLSVPVARADDETLEHDAALALLVDEAGLGGPEVMGSMGPANEPVLAPEENHADRPANRSDSAPDHPPALPEKGTDPRLGTGPRQRHPERDAADRLPGLRPRLGGAPRRGAVAPSDFTTRERERVTELGRRDRPHLSLTDATHSVRTHPARLRPTSTPRPWPPPARAESPVYTPKPALNPSGASELRGTAFSHTQGLVAMNRARKVEAKRKRAVQLRRRADERNTRLFEALGFGDYQSLGARGRARFSAIRVPPPEIILAPSPLLNTTPATTREYAEAVTVTLKTAPVTFNGVGLTLYEAYTALLPVVRHLSRRTEAPPSSPHEAEQDQAAFRAVEEGCNSYLHQVLHAFVAERTRFDRELLWYDAGVREDGRLVITIGARLPERRMVDIDSSARRVFRCGGSRGGGGFRWFDWPARLTGGDKSGETVPLYIQQHALDRLTERLPVPPAHLQASLLASVANPVPTHRNRDVVMIRFRMDDEYHLGHLVVRATPGAAVVTTFLFVTMQGTPEADLLRRELKLRRPDIEYTGLDRLLTYLDCDLARDDELARVFKSCGCEDLLRIKTEGRPVTRGLSASIRHHLGLASR